MNQQNQNVLILVLIILLLFLFLFSSKSNENENLQNIFRRKAELQQDLDEMIKDYTDVVVGKTFS